MSREGSVFRGPWDGQGLEHLRLTLDDAGGLVMDYPETFRRVAPR